MTGRTAVVTGGTRGIGRAISLALGHHGYRVYAIYARNREAAENLASEAKQGEMDIRCIRANLTDDEHLAVCMTQLKDETKRIDVVVHAAASGVHRGVADLTAKHLAWTFDVNVLGIHRFLLLLLPMMHSGGKIVGITSQGATHALPFYAAVGASKGALGALFRHYARELAPRGIAVNLVSPGLVLTEALGAMPDKEERIRAAALGTPTGRLTAPEDVAASVVFLSSDAAAQIVGQTIVIDGGKGLG
jgi:enoyl-[acyl-carrier protein] reductase III